MKTWSVRSRVLLCVRVCVWSILYKRKWATFNKSHYSIGSYPGQIQVTIRVSALSGSVLLTRFQPWARLLLVSYQQYSSRSCSISFPRWSICVLGPKTQMLDAGWRPTHVTIFFFLWSGCLQNCSPISKMYCPQRVSGILDLLMSECTALAALQNEVKDSESSLLIKQLL